MHQVDPAGDRLDPVDYPGEVLACGVSVAGIQAEADLAAALGGVADHVPEPGDRLEAARHRAIAPGGVLDQHGHRAVDSFHRLAPAVVAVFRVHSGAGIAPLHD